LLATNSASYFLSSSSFPDFKASIVVLFSFCCFENYSIMSIYYYYYSRIGIDLLLLLLLPPQIPCRPHLHLALLQLALNLVAICNPPWQITLLLLGFPCKVLQEYSPLVLLLHREIPSIEGMFACQGCALWEGLCCLCRISAHKQKPAWMSRCFRWDQSALLLCWVQTTDICHHARVSDYCWDTSLSRSFWLAVHSW